MNYHYLERKKRPLNIKLCDCVACYAIQITHYAIHIVRYTTALHTKVKEL